MTNKNILVPEILAPCGSYDILKAAVNAGCDACYIGGSKFGARAYAENIDSDSIVSSIDYAHLHDVKLYLTVNTLFKDNEIDELYGFLKPYYEAGIDAVIVQDLGVFSMIRHFFPDLDVHISTQMNVTSMHGASFFKKLGATRIVTAREMSLKEIKSIKDNVDIELEVFVHGAMCYSYSGQCLISSLAGGRSGNRGRCAQTCRKCYDNQYILSMKDMCSLLHIPMLMDIGVDSLKIEGRMKNEYYVASAVDAYRTIRDDYLSGNYSEKKAFAMEYKLANIFNRGGFCDGYFVKSKGADMISKEKPGNMGVKVGKVKTVGKGKIDILLSDDLFKQDVLEIRLKDDSMVELTSPICCKAHCTVTLNAPKSKMISTNSPVYRTRCNKLINEIEDCLVKENRRLNLDLLFEAKIGNILSLTGSFNIDNKIFKETVYSEYIVEESENHLIDKKDIKKKLSQLKDTNWSASNIEFVVDENAFVPAGEIKKIRRKLIDTINTNIVTNYRRIADNVFDFSDNTDSNIFSVASLKPLKISVTTLEQLEEVSKYNYIYGIYMSKILYIKAQKNGLIDKLKNKEVKIFISLPYVIKSNFSLSKYLTDIVFDGLYIRNIDGIVCVSDTFSVEELKKLDIICGAFIYAYNKQAITFIKSIIPNAVFEAPMELNFNELKQLSNNRLELKLYGYQRVMLSAQCVQNSKYGCNKSESVLKLKDDKNNIFYAKANCEECLGLIYNGIPYSFINNIDETEKLSPISYNIDFTIEDGEMVRSILDKYFDKTHLDMFSTTGHMFRGVE